MKALFFKKYLSTSKIPNMDINKCHLLFLEKSILNLFPYCRISFETDTFLEKKKL